jgi:hypothetical protein
VVIVFVILIFGFAAELQLKPPLQVDSVGESEATSFHLGCGVKSLGLVMF